MDARDEYRSGIGTKICTRAALVSPNAIPLKRHILTENSIKEVEQQETRSYRHASRATVSALCVQNCGDEFRFSIHIVSVSRRVLERLLGMSL